MTEPTKDSPTPASTSAPVGTALVTLPKADADGAGKSEPAAAAAPAAAAFMPGLRRWGAPVAIAAIAASLGWIVGQQNAGLHAAETQRAAAVSALETRVAAMEQGASKADVATLKTAIDVIARRLDEVGRTQTAATTLTNARFDRADKENAQRFDRLGERLERVEKQTSAQTPVSTIPKNAALPKPPEPERAPERAAEAAPLRNYVLREVFRGGAVVEGRQGMIEVFPGANLPGAGRVRSVERRDGKWVVITTAGVIDAD